ncbi:enterochelin esterase-like enzyme [Lewinella marina]|uniref:1,4-beta-xylanase n=1 Tax=Neolewinella marina TaxID=438751 RepID=A0A2G0CE46_9BACT|nr:alpha/beta hydrolase-fold protein [Neolewinella marina]NJB87449.1 enterochelin esterase-like enzyme [Neolewinella marina]PHK98242.1 1,4-beta-xylanase [Neolewinella marina]
MLKYLLLLFAFPLAAQSGYVNDNLSVTSRILGGERHYAVYLPPDYEASARSYPVLYLLHGGGDDHSGWVQFGEVARIADEAIRSGKATPMVIIMPDANTGHRGYFNRVGGNFRYEDFFFEELMPEVETRYRIRREKRYRAVAGLSMGGGGTFIYALHRPDLFSSACPLSASIRLLDREEMAARLRQAGDTVFTDQQLADYHEKYSALELVRNGDPEQIGSVRWYIDCGDDDFLYEGNSLMHILMREREIAHEYRVRDGGHTWTYWRESLPEVLDFVSQAFHQH